MVDDPDTASLIAKLLSKATVEGASPCGIQMIASFSAI